MPPPQLMFWDDQRIDDTVTLEYVQENIGGGKAENAALKERLLTPMSFGDGLTECTYAEWILDHARKFFLILLELGSPERIFQVVDGSWDDDDLPLTPETVSRLGLDNWSLEKRFLKKQHMFLLRTLERGSHIDYEEEEAIALETTSKRQPIAAPLGATTGIPTEKIFFPRERDVFYMRTRVPLGSGEYGESIEPEVFLAEVQASMAMSHKHIVSVYASYTHQNNGYILHTPACEFNLRQFIQYTPTSFKSLPKQKKRRTALEWLHCLSDALAYMYEKGVVHRDIRPRSILIDQTTNNILFADIGNLKKLDPEARNYAIDTESYEYAAPEYWQRAMASVESSSPSNTAFAGRAYRKTTAPGTPSGIAQALSNSSSTISSAGSSVMEAASPTSPTGSSGNTLHIGLSLWIASCNSPAKSDVFSLGCIFLDIITFLLKKRSSAFVAHRGKRQRRPRQTAASDQSFHANLGQVSTWIEMLESEAERKDDETISKVLRIIRCMLEKDPAERPHPREVSLALYRILAEEFMQPSGDAAGSEEFEGLHCIPVIDGISPVGNSTDLKRWTTRATSKTSRTSSTSSSSSSSSSSTNHGVERLNEFYGWDQHLQLQEGFEDLHENGMVFGSDLSSSPRKFTALHSGLSADAPKSAMKMKRNVGRFFAGFSI